MKHLIAPIANLLTTFINVAFTKGEFKPSRLLSLLIIMLAVGILTHVFGLEIAEEIMDLVSDASELTEE